MGFLFYGAMRRLKACAVSTVMFASVTGLSSVATPVSAQSQISYAGAPHVVRNDRGGLLRERLREIAALRKSNTRVEIRGAVCLSTCTMYLGLPNTCISPNTTFGFHGPSSYGRALDTATFNQASAVIARHYPRQLQEWYMDKGRFKIRSLYRVKGSNIIPMGVQSC